MNISEGIVGKVNNLNQYLNISEGIVGKVNNLNQYNERIGEQKGERSLQHKFCIVKNILNFKFYLPPTTEN
ncbi:hypothetical protein [Okeania sp. KiyG1]|uniref:hypothetical protein n=1 Tax=Okeania sp. KiyG1 TaxID=2720165 RepID=UPI0019247CA2|nr:hypothetical protein [Okeania sp. KiyG1]GGA36218.1 hypothetical protein CYANOKiyG1_54010 [Okeania sp. KiyG1]